jgi:hypothetical protein
MDQHICKNCQKIYSYCRGCLLSPISYRENGYCSESCQEAAKNQKEVIQQDVEVVITDRDISAS